MIKNKTVIISCAGVGKRLGRGIPKAIVDVCGESLILRTLKLLDDVEDVRIVVGYQAEKVIEEVLKYRKDVTFVFNHDYLNTGTGASVLLASKYSRDFIITIDGDLIIYPEDMKKILSYEGEFVGVTSISSEDAVLTEVDDDKVVKFARGSGQYEWTGVMQIKKEHTSPTDGHVYTILEPLLPMQMLKIRTKEIDTENDFIAASDWIKNNYSDL